MSCLPNILLTKAAESVAIIHRLAVVETESLFVYVPEEVERLNTHVSSADGPFQAGPEILRSLLFCQVYNNHHLAFESMN